MRPYRGTRRPAVVFALPASAVTATDAPSAGGDRGTDWPGAPGAAYLR
ncbi:MULTISPECIES: hypothetical protein [unclassified Streptomyces]